MRRTVFSLATALATFKCALAATLTVTTINDGGPASLRQLINVASPGDTINFSITGTITLTNGELLITNDLAILGPGPTNLVISGNFSNRVFEVASGANV